MLKEGVKGTQEIMVTEENTAKVMGSGALDVFATPAMIALMERLHGRVYSRI
jgi:fluoroacetyl-CoA thioesterase